MSAPIVQVGEKNLDRYQFAIKQLGEGRTNAVGVITLRASETTTTVDAPNCGAENRIFLFPATANAAGVVASTYVAESDVTKAQFVITHPSDADADKTFFWLALG